ncbi:MBL fold metallo-hydrolase [Chitinophaga agrisoli]|uniref:MBL fold metallo-hydrolase n=1 Tax=Chitinophaga agrisoli TaxID=2607653 RepID=A0A5B2VLC1_9BACT|nr:MBL fold metallo-hydrolase [Chitinophaga agrisoli]KAA2239508.1 MBL fold metallo-hydrolase [Chitinophaga agrisoli]
MKTMYPIHVILLFLLTIATNTLLAQQAAYYRIKVGRVEVIALSDGTVSLDAEKLLHTKAPDKAPALLRSAYLNNPIEVSINAFLIHTGDKMILLDTGSGELFGPHYGGRLVSSLRAAGYEPEQISDILLTHIHNDHSGGLSIQGKMVFPNAVIHVNKLDLDYWLDKERMEKADTVALSSNKKSFINAQKVFAPYLSAGKVKTFTEGMEVFPGIQRIPTPGHTPGHTIYVLESDGDKLVFWGDLIHVGGVQFADPGIPDGFDVDKEKGIAQRKRLYQEAAARGYLIAADHLSYPGLGRLRAAGNGYEWLPVPYSVSGRTK